MKRVLTVAVMMWTSVAMAYQQAPKKFEEKDTTKELAGLRADYLKISSRDDVNPFFAKIELLLKNPATPADVKFIGSLMLVIKPLEAMTFRAVELIRSNKNVHSLLLTHVMGSAVLRRNYYPTAQGEAFFKYLTEPQKHDRGVVSTLPKIPTMDVVQSEIDKVRVRLETAYKIIKDIDVEKERVLFDNRMVYGSGSFDDGIERFYQIGVAEKEATLASILMSIHGIKVFNAYNLNDLPNIVYSLGRTIGMDGFGLWNDIDGFPACRKSKIINDYPNFWVIKKNRVGANLLTSALKDLRQAVVHADAAWTNLKDRDITTEDGIMMADHYFYNPLRQSVHSLPNKRAVEDMIAMVAGEKEVRSPISGETAIVNLPAFYETPAEDLKALLPTTYVGECDENKRFTATDAGVAHRDYLWGSPIGWNRGAYAAFFRGQSDIAKASRVLIHSWGGWLGTPLVALVN